MCDGNLDQRVGLVTCERGLFGHSAKPGSAAEIVAVDPRFGFQSMRKSRLTHRQALEVATRHEMKE